MIGACRPAKAVGLQAALQHAACTCAKQRVLAIAPEFH